MARPRHQVPSRGPAHRSDARHPQMQRYATLFVARRKEHSDAETGSSVKKTCRARLEIGPADHGADRPVGPALDPADPVGTSRAAADLAGLARGLRRSLAHRASGAI